MAGLIVLGVVAFVLFIFVMQAVKIVHPNQRGLIEQFGRYKTTTDPGLKMIVPIIQKLIRVDMREQVIDVPPQEVITKDNVTVTVDAVIYYEPTDPQRLVYNVANFILAITKLAQTNLRNVIGDMSLDAALTSRDTVNVQLRQVLDDATDKWGVRVVRVEIQRIDPPTDVMDAMHEQMKAERTRRAVVLEADGHREAAIARAEGEKQARILHAEGVKQEAVLHAEGEAQAIREVADADRFREETVALGEAEAVRSVYQSPTAAPPRSSCRPTSRRRWARSAPSPSCSAATTVRPPQQSRRRQPPRTTSTSRSQALTEPVPSGTSSSSPSSSSTRSQPHMRASSDRPSSGPLAMSSSPAARRTPPRGRYT